MRVRLRYRVAVSIVILIGAGTALGIDLSRGDGTPATILVNPSLIAQSSQYVTLSDSTKLAANVLLPTSANEPNHGRVPTILRLTRYTLGWSQLDDGLRDAGFAIVNINERGTSASLGHLQQNADSYGADSGEIIRWIVDQPWSDGNVATYGISNDGALAALASIYGGHPLKAVAPLFVSADYVDLAYPGGIFSEWFTKRWSDYVRAIDLQQPLRFSPSGVGAQQAGALANEAIREHLDNLDWYSTAKRMPFRDDWKTMNPPKVMALIDRSGVPEYAIDGWWDNAFARGTIAQFLAGKGLGQLTIGPWNHGGSQSLDPLDPAVGDPGPFYPEFKRLVTWLKARVRSVPESGRRQIRYYVLGEGKWRTTSTWPPPGASMVKFSLAAGQRLAKSTRAIQTGVDRYPVWFGASSGNGSRWHTGMGGLKISFSDRRSQDKRLLTYTSAPLAKATLIAGTPSVSLRFSSTSKDAAVFVYLEAIAPGGRVAYLTEGELRASDRAVSGFDALGPIHPFTRKAARPLRAAPVDLEIGLLPIAARLPAGYRLRIAIAGAGAGSFERVPAHGPATFTIGRGGSKGSFLSLPVIGQ